MTSYTILEPDEAQASAILQAFPRMADLPEPLRSQAVVAWHSMVASSAYPRLAEVPFSQGCPDTLVDHTNDVVEAGLALADVAERRWALKVDRTRLLAILLLHDLDKPLLSTGHGDTYAPTPVAARIPHGVLAGLMLAQLGVEEAIVAAVATHATHAPLRGPEPEVLILHYADLFAADHLISQTPRMPFFRLCR